MTPEKTRVRRPVFGVGTISLLVIFTVLCLSTLSLLGYSTARQSRDTTERALRNTAALAQAQGATDQTLAEIDSLLLQLRGSQTAAAYRAAALAALQERGYAVDAANWRVTITLPIDEHNLLITQIRILPADAALRYAVLRQTTLKIDEWSPGEQGGLWPG